MKKIVQLAVNNIPAVECDHDNHEAVYALCDDGSLYVMYTTFHSNIEKCKWVRVPPIEDSELGKCGDFQEGDS